MKFVKLKIIFKSGRVLESIGDEDSVNGALSAFRSSSKEADKGLVSSLSLCESNATRMDCKFDDISAMYVEEI